MKKNLSEKAVTSKAGKVALKVRAVVFEVVFWVCCFLGLCCV